MSWFPLHFWKIFLLDIELYGLTVLSFWYLIICSWFLMRNTLVFCHRPLPHMYRLSGCFSIVFESFIMVSLAVFLYIYPVWDFLSFLNLSVMLLSYLARFQPLLKYFLDIVLFIFSGTEILGVLLWSHRSLRITVHFFLKSTFSSFSNYIISNVLSLHLLYFCLYCFSSAAEPSSWGFLTFTVIFSSKVSNFPFLYFLFPVDFSLA